MTERHNEPSADRPMTTGEFRAAPDLSASTAQFQKFADDQAERGQIRDAGPGRNPRIALLIVAVILVLAIIAILGATLS